MKFQIILVFKFESNFKSNQISNSNSKMLMAASCCQHQKQDALKQHEFAQRACQQGGLRSIQKLFDMFDRFDRTDRGAQPPGPGSPQYGKLLRTGRVQGAGPPQSNTIDSIFFSTRSIIELVAAVDRPDDASIKFLKVAPACAPGPA